MIKALRLSGQQSCQVIEWVAGPSVSKIWSRGASWCQQPGTREQVLTVLALRQENPFDRFSFVSNVYHVKIGVARMVT